MARIPEDFNVDQDDHDAARIVDELITWERQDSRSDRAWMTALLERTLCRAEAAYGDLYLREFYRLAAEMWPEQRPWFGKETIPPTLRALTLARDGDTCTACGSTVALAVDHVIPESKGGPTIEQNTQALCRDCNQSKGGRI